MRYDTIKKKEKPIIIFRVCLNSMNFIACFYPCFGNIENIFMTGVKLVPFMEHRGTASGVAVVWNVETADHRKF